MKSVYKMEMRIENRPDMMFSGRVNLKDLFLQIRKSRMPFALAINSVRRNGRMSNMGQNLKDTLNRWRSDYNAHMTNKTAYVVVSRTVQGRTFSSSYPLGSYLTKDELNEGIDLLQYRRQAVEHIKREIRNYRQDLKHISNHIFHRRPGGLLKEFQSKVLKLPKQPRDGSQYVGIEIECVTPHNADLTTLLPFSKYINVGTDGSVEAGRNETGSEFRVCIKRDEIREVLPKIMQAIKGLGATVNKSCGLHVHMDQRHHKDRNEVAAVFQRLVRSLGLLYTVVPLSRRRNTYCKRNRYADFDRARNGDRYKAVNASAYHRHGTIEVRLFGGTLEETKIINWIETLYAIAEGETVLRCPKTFDTALKYWKLSDENLAWLKARQEQFAEANAKMPVSENETEENNHIMDEYEEESDECGDCGNHRDDCDCGREEEAA